MELLSIGKILNFHGIKGEVKVGFTQGNEQVLSELKKIYAVQGKKTSELNITGLRFHKKFALMKFKEINSVDEVLEYKGALLKAPKEKLEKHLEEDEFYINDLVGLKAYDEKGQLLGEVSGVLNIKGQDTLFIKDQNKKEHMVPFNRELVPEVNPEKGRMTIKLIEGLLEK